MTASNSYFGATVQQAGQPVHKGDVGVTTIAATMTMTDAYCGVQLINGGTATRKVLMPAEKTGGGQSIVVVNKGATNDLQVKDDGDATLIQTLRPGEGCVVATDQDGPTWYVVKCFNDQVPVFQVSWVYGEATQIDASFMVMPVAVRVIAVNLRPLVVGSDGGAVTATVKKAASGTAIASGVNLLSAELDLKGTINTNAAGALTATAADLDVAAGTAIGVDYTGTLTAARGVITVAYTMA